MTKWAHEVARTLVLRPAEFALADLEELLRGEVDLAEEPELAEEGKRLLEMVRSGKDIRVSVLYRFRVDGDLAVVAGVRGDAVLSADHFTVD